MLYYSTLHATITAVVSQTRVTIKMCITANIGRNNAHNFEYKFILTLPIFLLKFIIDFCFPTSLYNELLICCTYRKQYLWKHFSLIDELLIFQAEAKRKQLNHLIFVIVWSLFVPDTLNSLKRNPTRIKK